MQITNRAKLITDAWARFIYFARWPEADENGAVGGEALKMVMKILDRDVKAKKSVTDTPEAKFFMKYYYAVGSAESQLAKTLHAAVNKDKVAAKGKAKPKSAAKGKAKVKIDTDADAYAANLFARV